MEGLIIGVPINFTKTKQFRSFMKRVVAVNGSMLRFTDTINLLHHIKSLQSLFDSLGCANELGPGANWGDVGSQVIKKASEASKQGNKDALTGDFRATVGVRGKTPNGTSRSSVESSSAQLRDHGDVARKRRECKSISQPGK